MVDFIDISLPSDLEAVRKRFSEKFDVQECGCWVWNASLDYRGYGRFRWNSPRSVLRAHRASYAIHVRPPLPHEVVCHSCDNPACVNPDHLFVGSFADNTHDMLSKRRWIKPRPPRGERNGKTTLTEKDILAIRADARTYAEIGAEYGLSKAGISHIKARRVWTHI